MATGTAAIEKEVFMSSKPTGATSGVRGIHWQAVASGWAMAALTGFVLSFILRLLHGLFADPPLERGELTATVVAISLVAGFLSYVVGGYVAARMARYSGGKHGVLTAVFGLVIGLILSIVLALLGIVFTGGVAVPPASFGLAGSTLVAGLVLFLVNLLGGFVGGKLGEPVTRT